MRPLAVSRRRLLGGAAGMGVAFFGRAQAAGAALAGRKLVVVVCRGGMDGLAVSPPVGAPDYAALRGAIAFAPEEVLPLNGDFGLHPSLVGFRALATRGQARIVPALASPDRARSHFEAQDVLESGASSAYGAETGWLNRTLQALNPGRTAQRPPLSCVDPPSPGPGPRVERPRPVPACQAC